MLTSEEIMNSDLHPPNCHLMIGDGPCTCRIGRWSDQVAQLENALHQEGHIIIFTEDGWSIQHPVECRPDMISCAIHRYMNEHAPFPVEGFGKYKVGLSIDLMWFEAIEVKDE